MKKVALIIFLLSSMINAFSQTIRKSAKPPIKQTSVAKKKVSTSNAPCSLSPLFYIYKEGEWTKYTERACSLGELYKKLGIDGRTYATSPECSEKGKDCFMMIGYKLFTDEPQWAMIHDTIGIRKYARSFDLEDFLSSWKFEFELKGGIEKRSLYDAFLLEALGAPDRRTSYFDAASSFEVWHYDSHGLSITLKNGIAVSYIKVD